MTTKSRLLLCTAIMGSGFGLAAGTAHAQTDAEEQGGLEEIIVTATKRDASQQDTALAITTLTTNMIDNAFLTDVRAISDLTPNLTITTQTGFNAVAGGIRGTGSISILVTQDSSVGFLVDDFALSNVQSQFVELFDVQQVEIYRGPQGTLFGKNTTGGVISIQSKRPVFNEMTGKVEADFGGYETGGAIAKLKAAVNIPIVDDKMALRVAMIYDYDDGYYKNTKDTATYPESIPFFGLFGLPVDNPPLPPGLDTSVGDGKFLGGKKVLAAKAKLLWQPSKNYEGYLIYEHVADRSDSPAAVNETPGGQGFLVELLGFPGIQAAGHTDVFSTGSTNNGPEVIDVAGGHDVTINGFYLNQTVSLDQFTLKSITGYREQKETLPSTYTGEAYTSIFDATRNLEREAFQQEVRIISEFADSPFNFVAGGAYFIDNVDFFAFRSVGLQSLIPAWNAVTGSFYDEDGNVNLDLDLTTDGDFQTAIQERDSWALYFDGNYDVNDKLRFSAGVRYTQDDKTFNRQIDGGGVCNQYTRAQDALAIDPALPVDPANNVNCIDVRSNAISRAGLTNADLDPHTVPFGPEHFGLVVNTKSDWNALTWRFALDYSVNEDVMAYASYSNGFISGGFTETCSSAATCKPFDEESNDNFEVGFKADLADNTVRLNVAAFLTKFSDLQRNQVVPYVNALGNTVQETITINTGKSTAYGLEAELTWVPTAHLRLEGSIGYLNSSYDEFLLDQTPGDGIDNPDDLSDLTPPFSSKWQIRGGATYEVPLSGIEGSLTLNANFHYQSEAEFSVFNSDLTQLHARTLLNASMTYRDSSDRYHVTLYGKNLANETHRTSANSVAGLWNFTQYGAPLEGGIQIGASF